ncbi:hypothetical protein FTO74_15900 [Granulicella sp. WH15]|uniref:hypothetical protein n=1 Tax=Granulicella sp. WH15 TaxID=2602070 RepID=UPI0013669246|nr:hypothetical protein [Granulicella sp. WH15]QHN04675.1 hypothetical protein FTO74_15900 [Granulicella sp. WH15]
MMNRSYTDVTKMRDSLQQSFLLKKLMWGVALCGIAIVPCHAQDTANPVEVSSSAGASLLPDTSLLPDAPGFSTSYAASHEGVADDAFAAQPTQTRVASMHDRTIRVGVTAPRLSVGDKILLGLSVATSTKAMIGWAASATYEQAIDGSPNYGQSAKGFVQRLGAASARASSNTIFTDSILAPILHEDPRYYEMGNRSGYIKRFFYAGTRTIITRDDNGHPTPNFAMLGGNLAGAALTQAYYPSRNTGFGPTMKTFGGSMAGAAVGFIVEEFFRDSIDRLYHKATD